MSISLGLANRLGFGILGLTNNFAYVIMLAAAFDLLKSSETPPPSTDMVNNSTQKYCNEHSTATILLANTIPSLTVKIIYPIFFVNLPTAFKASTTALLSAASFLTTGLFTSQTLIYTGVAFASFSSGLGESTYLSHTPLYGDSSLNGWSIGTGGAGLFGAVAYALLRMILSIKAIMIIMLIVPVAMLLAYFFVIKPVVQSSIDKCNDSGGDTDADIIYQQSLQSNLAITSSYGSVADSHGQPQPAQVNCVTFSQPITEKFGWREKYHYLLTLSKYFMPLLLVYFAEYFINQGLFELIYYPEVSFLDKPSQYRWFQVSYQLGVMISRSSLDFIQIKRLWTMSLLQALNAVVFLAHSSKLIHIPSFYLVIVIIVYEGLLGGFTYANTFYRMKKEVVRERSEFAISTVTIADTLGIVMSAVVALPVHDALCKLY